MKPFIVFLALFLTFMAGFAYIEDMAQYRFAQETLKAAAEECCIEAALATDEEAFGNGALKFDRSEGIRCAERMLEHFETQMRSLNIEKMGFALAWEDDLGSGEYYSEGLSIAEVGEVLGNPAPGSVRAVLCAKTKDFFRLPFLEVCVLCRAAGYSYEEVGAGL